MPIDFECPHCGKVTVVAEDYVGRSGPCAGCGAVVTVTGERNPFADLPAPSDHPAPVPRQPGDELALRILLPVGRSPWAIAAGYAGLFSVLCFPAPIALLLGIVAIRDIKRHPERHGMGRAIFGLVMGALFTIGLVISLIGLAAGW